ncbi:MAG TPA: DUF4412 domain-containing protein [Candidatus Krumholzibacteria bacterium]|nr:DUF4412 domain-containing protein [Candidatus Krumholzibacteria bacterium]HPD70493.1 DUF4412 domain-containing protein [Candidatus Krumholzibacteria bacterium]HRY39807.1 DUF4412 domain-containing protein [Candidatus Krumholzibacteria bacterium]
MIRRPLVTVCLALVAAGLVAGCARQDSRELVVARKLVTENRNEAMALPGQDIPAAVDTVTLWIGPAMARRDTPDGTFLIDAAQGRLTFVNERTRTWTTLTTAQAAQQLMALAADTSAASLGGDPDERLRHLLKVSARVTDTGEEAVIDGYRCRRWIVEQLLGEQFTMTELWLTREIDVDFGLLHQATRPALGALPGGAAALAELSRLDGVPVRATGALRLLNREGRLESRLLSVETVTVPRSFFQPPAGYRQGEPVDAPRK